MPEMEKYLAEIEIQKLLNKYNNDLKENKLNKYTEEETKKDYILPLFRALGWNVEDKNEVSAEEKISKKRVDYGFRIRGIPQFFLEAKSFREGTNQPESIKQAINYAWHKGCTWAVLTDFSEIVILNAEWKSQNLAHNRFITLSSDEYIKEFETLWLLSKTGFEQDLLDKKAEKVGKKDKKSPVDKQLVSDFTRFRTLLLNDISQRNPDKNLSDDELDESVQRILDRLIFIRTCEDRELEEKQLIEKLRDWKSKRKGLFIKDIRDLFSYFDQEYNSKIFSKHLCDQLEIGYEPLVETIEGLYHTKDHFISYDFSAIEADALGNIYEQYLGHILKKTEDGVNLKKNGVHRKKQGIYYTGTFIVDFIVRNSLGELLKDKSIQNENVKILDPSCGSGSFLIKAFDIMYEKYREIEQYSKTSQTELDLKFVTSSPFTTKAKIIKENIFGVDLDKQAIEISQLNLLLKIAEKGQRLPLLQENIQCGNSLIEDKNIAPDRAFKWEDNFLEILKNGGFYAIIGNPPYIFARDKKFSDIEKQYFYQNYSLGKYQLNSYLLFIERSINLLKEGGYLGFIIPNTWHTIDSYLKFRQFLFNKMSDIKIVNIPKKVFLDANVETSILIFKKTPISNKNLTLYEFKENKFEKVYEGHSSVLGENYIVRFNLGTVETIHKTKEIMKKIESSSIQLKEISTVKSGLKAYEVGKSAGAEGRTRTDTRVAPQQFLRLPRLPFRHFGPAGVNMVPRPRIELGTRRFSVYCSTD